MPNCNYKPCAKPATRMVSRRTNDGHAHRPATADVPYCAAHARSIMRGPAYGATGSRPMADTASPAVQAQSHTLKG